MWVNSFRRVGLDPINWPTWYQWVDKIKPFLQSGALFRIEVNIGVGVNYSMLPEYFHGINSEEKFTGGYNEESQHVLISSLCWLDSQFVVHTYVLH